MAVVETFLLGQLGGAIRRTPDNSLSKMFQLHKECGEIKDSIETQMPKDGAPVDSKVKENLYYLNNVMTEWHLLLKEHHLPTPEAMRLVNNLRGRLKQIKKDLPDEFRETQDGKQPDEEIYRWSCRSVDPAKIYGVEDIAMIMERLLVKEGFKAIGIVGMAGVGKTALCQKAFNNQQVKKHFLPRIWVCLSKQHNVDDYKEELVKMILMCLGFEKKIIAKIGQGGLTRLLPALQQQLKRQRYLIVLDDLWNKEENFKNFCSSLTQDDKKEDQMEYGLPKRHGGAVIVTSRSPIMIETMVGEKNLQRLPLADKDSCWKIFKDAVEKDGIALSEDTQELKDEIEKKCAGLPLTARMLGQIEHEKAKGQKKNHQSEAQEETHQQEA